jgi:hypothetical protein
MPGDWIAGRCARRIRLPVAKPISPAMQHYSPLIMHQLSLRVNPANPNHHLWNNNGTWFIHYVVHPTPFTKDRIRRSLGTKSLAEARARRDAILGQPQLALAA